MADTSTSMEYEITRNGANKIDEDGNRMESIFGDFGNSMTKILNPDIFKGIAAEEVGSDYQTVKDQFDDFLLLVRNFASEYRRAANIMEQHETKLKASTSVLNQDLERM